MENKTSKVLDPQLSLTSKKFKNIMKNLFKVDEDHLFFSITRDHYYADYKPNYPEESAADMTVIVNHWNGTGEIRGNFSALVPTIKKYDNLRSLFEDIKIMKIPLSTYRRIKAQEFFS